MAKTLMLSHMVEAFLNLFMRRIVPKGLYILDEPEVPLSPMKQLALIKLVMDAAKQGSQFIIVTHSPMLMAIPEAKILYLSEDGAEQVPYDELEHVQMMRSFMSNPQAFIGKL